jgi:epoxyqueuosine reductase
MNTIREILKKNLIPGTGYIYGFADLDGLSRETAGGFRYGISIGRRLDDKIVSRIINGPTREYYEHYLNVNDELSYLTERIVSDLKNTGTEAKAIAPTISTYDLDTKYADSLRTELSHKMVATRAGLGWIGKSDLFISRQFGPRLRLVSILVKTPLEAILKPIDKSFCGKCNICVEACPARAANGKLWDINTDREEFFDPWKCRDQCARFGRISPGNNARVCGICVAVCPVGMKN